MIDHVSIAVSDLPSAMRFYEAVLGAIGYAALDIRGSTVGFGKKYSEFWLNARPDMAPLPEKSAALNAAELLRDPSHVRALPVEEMVGLFDQAGLATPQVSSYRMEGEFEDLLSRSFPSEGDADRLRTIFADSIADDTLDLNTRQADGKIYYSFPVAVLVARKID